MSFAREGYPFAAAGLLLAGVCWAAVWAGVAGSEGWAARGLYVLAGVASLLAIFVLWFFRDPTPVLPSDAAAVVAPGQGRIIVVEDVDHVEVVDGPATKISIFLSVFDVHVQRSPVSGEVVHKEYRPGTYVAAWADKASEDNEQASLGIRSDEGTVLVKQIAGLIARRIVTDPAVGDSLERGERFGLIRFGSRVDLFLPAHWEVTTKVGEKVRAGSTPIALKRAAAQDSTSQASAGTTADASTQEDPR